MRGGAAWTMLTGKSRYGVVLRVRGVREDARYKPTLPSPLPYPVKHGTNTPGLRILMILLTFKEKAAEHNMAKKSESSVVLSIADDVICNTGNKYVAFVGVLAVNCERGYCTIHLKQFAVELLE